MDEEEEEEERVGVLSDGWFREVVGSVWWVKEEVGSDG